MAYQPVKPRKEGAFRDFVCERCGEDFKAYSIHRSHARCYCSGACANAAIGEAKRKWFNCETCGKRESYVGARARRFCSRQCRVVRPESRKIWNGYAMIRLPLSERQKYHRRAHTKRLARAWIFEHIAIAERALGRPLKKGEVVHHINCDSTDNSPSNLLVCRRDYHAWLHGEMSRRWAREHLGGAPSLI